MDDQPLPYFFPEALRVIKRLNERERQRGITERDREFLRNLFFADADARLAQTPPMIAERLLINLAGHEPMELAGAFMMSSEGSYTPVFFYGPHTGLEKFSDAAQLLDTLEKRLQDDAQRGELLHFLAMDDRIGLDFKPRASLTRQLIEGNVFDEQQACIERGQNRNVQTLLNELSKLPLVATLLDQLLASTLRKSFPNVDQRKTHVFFYARVSSTTDQEKWVNALLLRDALLLFYRQHAWPVGLRRVFTNPDVNGHPGTHTQAQDLSRWEDGIQQASHQLHLYLNGSLRTFWNTDVYAGWPRHKYFAQAMSDKSRVDLLFKRQQEVFTPEQWQQLNALYLSTDRQHGPLTDKVRLWEHAAYYVELAGTLVVTHPDAYLYTQSRGWQVLKDEHDLTATLKAMAVAPGHEDDFFGFLALEERARFVGFENPQFSSVPFTGPIFSTLLETVIGKQQQNLEYCLDLYRRNQGTVNAYAMLDYGLDIRAMLDHRLLALDAKGRWSTHPCAPSVPAEKARLTLRRLHSVSLALDTLKAQVPSLESVISQQLHATLTASEASQLNPRNLYINHYAGNADTQERRTPRSSQSVLVHCIARLLGQAQAIPDTAQYGVYGPRIRGQATKRPELGIDRLNRMVEQWLLGLSRQPIAQIPRAGLEALIPKLAHSMSVGILEEARLRGLDKTLDERDIQILQTVLDPDNTVRGQNAVLKGFTPQAFTLSVLAAGQTDLLRLANCFVLTERGGLDQHHSGHALLWTPAAGVEAFASSSYLREVLVQRLHSPTLRLGLLENLSAAQHIPHRRYELGPLQLMTKPVLQQCQQSWIEHYLAQRQYTMTLKGQASSLAQALGQLPSKVAANNLQRAMDIARLAELRHSLHDRLGAAPPREQRRHAEILEQYRIHTLHGRDYLYELESLRQYVEGRLNDMLVDYSTYATGVEIVPRLALAGRRQSLLDFAMGPTSAQAAEFEVVSLATGLTQTVVRQMLTQLNIQSDYHTYLNQKLSAGAAGVAQRLQDFSQQLPWQLLQHAHALKLQERLSDVGFELLQQAFDMPDAVARALVPGSTAQVRPLELLATAGASLAPALGLYLISAGREGPQVLYAPYHPSLSLHEFESEAQFVQALNTPGALQDWVLRRLAAPQDATYRNLLASSQGDTSEITLGFNPIRGNLLGRLFDDNRQLLLSLLGSQLIQGAESEWQAVTQVLSGSVGRVLGLLPGKLALPWVIWHSISLFTESAEALQDHHWGLALQKFIDGLAQMAALGQALQDAKALIFDPEQPPSVAPTQPSGDWSTLDLTAPQRTLLAPSEVNDVALTDMTLNAFNGTYQHKGVPYIALAGKVYRVESLGTSWRIRTAENHGPFVYRDSAGQWLLDTRQKIARYGQAFGRLQDRADVSASARTSMNIEAVGMKSIRQLYPERARIIVEAIDLATFYVQNCKLNLALLEPGIAPVTRIHRFVNSFFGIDINPDHGPQEIAPTLVQKLHRIVDLILAGLLDPSLYALDSKRFVVGSHRIDPQNNWGFTIDKDPDRRIFLTERFFAPLLSVYDDRLTDYFDREAHARATLLIHELSHLVATTADAAYLDSVMPFSDLIETLTEAGRELATYQKNRQATGYSHKTPASRLFKYVDIAGNFWRDFGSTPETEYIRDQILRTTGGVDLSNARGIFMTNLGKRVDTILDNADSVALLITHLGRQLDPVPSDRKVSMG
ncbi:MAG: dermonecrotic toxin domain-containing protein [Pseudomonas proteolytica]|uniref:dermonecrotic toxin domain-containing protein n=1 Tax=Pseudomonas proteolytica TaxID=219574 RepID=UPI003F2FD32C